MARPATLTMLILLIAGTINYADAKSGVAGAVGAAAAKQVGKATASTTCHTIPGYTTTVNGHQVKVLPTTYRTRN